MERKTTLGLLTAVALIVGMATAGSSPSRRATAKPVRLSEATMIVEINATDGDAGLQLFLDGEPWRRMTITAPNGRQILAVNTKTRWLMRVASPRMILRIGSTSGGASAERPPCGPGSKA